MVPNTAGHERRDERVAVRRARLRRAIQLSRGVEQRDGLIDAVQCTGRALAAAAN
jgi:hypothetical protein